ncbi:CPBP family intramembrane glutamic endopeptidase [Companilactobacillus alimentarius]|uniref:CPBP family intramembrane glutamic endopeptidase n=1 Tax=Companilactobacillus alimentarius TaxID=1602 RepID=UPI0028BB3192|nr:CPBP family intramembrane glutamic endopeptidase [Companilactobacillus alimentarius]MDT6952293.1 CPBP family intramembrane glutamic endopeptidase [Companilactobacillus alimentarius]
MNFKIEYLLSGLEAGIAEELLFRYAFLTILLAVFQNFRFKIFWASLISSLCFGLLHLSNISAGQDLPNTINQVIFAFGMGLLMSGIYLYTNLFYLPVFFHTLLDTLAFTTSGELMTGKVTSLDNVFTIIEALIFVAIALMLLIAVYRRQNSRSSFEF